MSGNMGCEMDVTKLSDDEKAEIKDQVSHYKEIRETVQFGDFYRLKSPFESDEAAWMFISKDKKDIVVDYFIVLASCNFKSNVLRLKGLDAEKKYRDEATGKIFGGDELMYAGLVIPELPGDFQSHSWNFKQI